MRILAAFSFTVPYILIADIYIQLFPFVTKIIKIWTLFSSIYHQFIMIVEVSFKQSLLWY